MRKNPSWKRIACAGALAAVCTAACDSVLDIESPKMRPSSSGEASEPSAGTPNSGGDSNRSATPLFADAGEPPSADMGGNGAGPDQAGEAGQAGRAGQAGAADCEADAVRCAGDGGQSPQICDASGHWTPNTTQASGACP